MEIVQYSFLDGKVCTRCGEWKSYENFHRQSQMQDGRHIYCKTCRKTYYVPKDELARSTFKERQRAASRRKSIKYRKEHKEEVKKYLRFYYEANKERLDKNNRMYRKLHPECQQIVCRRYFARKRGAGGSFTPKEWRNLCEQYDHRCLCCGAQKKLTADHIVPMSSGGSNTIDNIQPLCQSCNSRKGAKTIDYRKNLEYSSKQTAAR